MSEEEKPKKKREARPAVRRLSRKRSRCPYDTFEKIMPYVDAIEHYHLAHAGEGIAVSEFRMNDEAQKFFELNRGTFADTYVVSGVVERRAFRQLADQLRERNIEDIRELKRMAKLETPRELPPAADPHGA